MLCRNERLYASRDFTAGGAERIAVQVRQPDPANSFGRFYAAACKTCAVAIKRNAIPRHAMPHRFEVRRRPAGDSRLLPYFIHDFFVREQRPFGLDRKAREIPQAGPAFRWF